MTTSFPETNAPTNVSEPRDRPWTIYALLVFFMIGFVFNSAINDRSLLYLVVAALSLVVMLWGIWYAKRWAFVLASAIPIVALIGTVLYVAADRSLNPAELGLFAIPVAQLGALFHPATRRFFKKFSPASKD